MWNLTAAQRQLLLSRSAEEEEGAKNGPKPPVRRYTLAEMEEISRRSRGAGETGEAGMSSDEISPQLGEGDTRES